MAKLKKCFFILVLMPLFLMAIEVKTVVGQEIAPYAPTLAALCNTVFREYPYLYSGNDADYTDYLLSYAHSKNGVVAIAFDGGKPVGVATGIPLEETWGKYQQPFKERGYNIATLFYHGEMAILPPYRNQGIEERLYDKIEEYAKGQNCFRAITFMAIELGSISKEEQTSQALWIKQGFQRHPEIHFDNFWTDIGKNEKTPHHMVFWLKPI